MSCQKGVWDLYYSQARLSKAFQDSRGLLSELLPKGTETCCHQLHHAMNHTLSDEEGNRIICQRKIVQ